MASASAAAASPSPSPSTPDSPSAPSRAAAAIRLASSTSLVSATSSVVASRTARETSAGVSAASATAHVSALASLGASRHHTPPPRSGAARKNAAATRGPSAPSFPAPSFSRAALEKEASGTANDATPALTPAASGGAASPVGNHARSDAPASSATAIARAETLTAQNSPSARISPNSQRRGF